MVSICCMMYLEGRVQTWCPGSVLWHGHQCECSILEVPLQKLRSTVPGYGHLSAQDSISAMLFTHAIWSWGGETADETIAIIDAYSEKMVLGTLSEQHSF